MKIQLSKFNSVLVSILKLALRPLWRLRRFLLKPRYRPEKYWHCRLAKYSFSLCGVGNCTLSEEENRRAYSEARKTFLELCVQERVDFQTVYMLDVGCGSGFYAKLFLEAGGMRYLGLDITDQLFAELRRKLPDFQFRKLDISKQKLEGCFDLVIMIDVTQHIVKARRFSFAMQNIRSHLAEDGVFIVTSWLSNELIHRTYYEVARPLSYYKTEFPGYYFSESVPFRDKFIFAIRKRGYQS